MAPSGHSKQHATHASILAKVSTAFILKLYCHWLKCLLRRHIALVTHDSVSAVSLAYLADIDPGMAALMGCIHYQSILKYFSSLPKQYIYIYPFTILKLTFRLWCHPMFIICKWFDSSTLIYSQTYFWQMGILNKNREWHGAQITGWEILFIDFYGIACWISSHHYVSIIGGILCHSRSDCSPDSHGGV